MTSISKALVAVSFMTLSNIGCGSDTAAPASTTTLTEEEANAVASALSETMGDVISDSNTRLAARIRLTSSTVTVERTSDCNEGGTRVIAGERTSEATSSSISGSYDVTSTLTDCGVNTDSNKTILLDGSVDHTGTINIEASGQNITGTIHMSANGSVDVSGENITAGTCGVNIDVDATLNGTTVDVSASGTICGTTITYSATESLSN